MVIDLGNGILASTVGFHEAPFVLTDKASGLDVPEFEVPLTEAGVLDGGTVGASRTKARRMILPLIHDAEMTTYAIMQLFSRGVERTISTERGSMPYYVEAVRFPVPRENLFTIVIVSPDAYPAMPTESEQTGSATGGLTYPYTYPYTYESFAAVAALAVTNTGEVASPCEVKFIMGVDAANVAITINGRTTTITDTLTTGDVVVVDGSTYTVTVNGVSSLSAFSRAGSWPSLDPGYNAITTTRVGQIFVTWQPRMMGLI